MPETVKKYTVFLASPSDLEDDRQSIHEVIQELNITFGRPQGLIIDIVKWETDSAPGISQGNIQGLITNDIGDNYDLFIGLMWRKFGTPTARAGSGTEEEYLRAFQRFKDDPNSLQVLFYFKTSSPESIYEIDPEELIKVINFRNMLKEQNVLFGEYGTIEALHGYLRLHIPKRINSLKESESKNIKKIDTVEIDEIHTNNELGLLDYSEISSTRFDESITALNNIAQATQWIGEKITEKADEINKLTKVQNQVDSNRLRKIFKLTAQIMNQYASRLDVETPIFFSSYEEAIKAFSGIINIVDDFYDSHNIHELHGAKQSIVKMNSGITQGIESMQGFYNSVNSLPRIEKGINKAKRNLAEKLGYLINKLQACSKLAEELISEISDKIDRLTK